MPECEYCGASFDTEAEELAHLESEHRDELGPIDERRIRGTGTDGRAVPVTAIAVGVVLVVGVSVAAYAVFAGGNGGTADEPRSVGSVHTHGTIEAVIDGEELDFEDAEFLTGNSAFHFHEGYQDEYGEDIYHIHARDVTLQYALSTLGIDVNDEGTVLEFRGETYDDSDPDTSVEITVDGEPVEPGDHVLQGVPDEGEAARGAGDDVRIVVETE